jgi:hypothetical protein
MKDQKDSNDMKCTRALRGDRSEVVVGEAETAAFEDRI